MATAHADEMLQLYKVLRNRITQSQETITRYYNRNRTEITFKPGELVWLKGANIRTKRPIKKLDDKLYGPFMIDETVHGERAYRLILPDSINSIFPVFNVSLLEKYTPPRPGQPAPEDNPIVIDDTPQWQVDRILDSELTDTGVSYKVRWVGDWEDSWETAENLAGSPEHLRDFHDAHPDKPRPEARQLNPHIWQHLTSRDPTGTALVPQSTIQATLPTRHTGQDMDAEATTVPRDTVQVVIPRRHTGQNMPAEATTVPRDTARAVIPRRDTETDDDSDSDQSSDTTIEDPGDDPNDPDYVPPTQGSTD